MKYKPLTDMGIPLILAEYPNTNGKGAATRSLTEQAIKQFGPNASVQGLILPNLNVDGVADVGCLRTDGGGVVPGAGPAPLPSQATPVAVAPLMQGHAVEQPAAWDTGSTLAEVSPYHPSTGQWAPAEYDRLQPYAKPSIFNTNTPLPQQGGYNQYANQTQWSPVSTKAIEVMYPDEPQVKKESFGKQKVEPRLPTVEPKKEMVTFYDPLHSKDERSAARTPTDVVASFGSAKIECVPREAAPGTRLTVAWSCGGGATGSAGLGFETKNYLIGSTRVRAASTTRYTVQCYIEESLVGSADCTIALSKQKKMSKPQQKKAPVFGSTASVESETKGNHLCIFSFCI
jgi:hypothetical protein